MGSPQPHFAPAPPGRLLHAAGECLPRHCHAHAFAAVVLRGRYVEAGDQGRYHVTAGDVLIHEAFESHLDSVGREGAEVIVLPLPSDLRLHAFARHHDPDSIARVVDRDPREATELLLTGLRGMPARQMDWPDALAAALRANPSLAIGPWAREMSLRPETISRGFRAAYGVSPANFRATARARAAFAHIQHTARSLSDIAFAQGFADQSHMTRAIVALSGRPPSHWRR